MDSAEERFCAEVRKLTEQYRDEGEAISRRYAEAREAAERAEAEAKEAYTSAARAHNAKYSTLLAEAASRAAADSEHPEGIRDAVRIVGTLMGGVINSAVTIGDPENARRAIEQAAAKREARERFEREQRGIVGRDIRGRIIRKC